MKVAIITDTHWGARSDASIFLDYQKQMLDNQFFPYLEANQITTVLHLGDLVDRRKYINFNTSSRMKSDFLDRLVGYNVHIIVGNHDVFYKNTNQVNAFTQLLGEYKFNCYYQATEVNLAGFNLLFVPWINDDNRLHTFETIAKTTSQLCFGHFELNGYEMNTGNVCHDGLDPNLLQKFDLVFSGHFHKKSAGNNVHYLGSPWEMTWGESNDPHGFHILDLNTRTIEFVENQYKLFNRMIYNDDQKTFEQLIEETKQISLTNKFCKVVVQEKHNPYWFDLYIQAIEQQKPYDLKIVDLAPVQIDNKPVVNQSLDTMQVLIETIEQLDVQVDKRQLQQMIINLYRQSNMLEV